MVALGYGLFDINELLCLISFGEGIFNFIFYVGVAGVLFMACFLNLGTLGFGGAC
jgi:hypothetical protein